MFRSGEGVLKNYNKAFFWFSLSASQGNSRAKKYKYMVQNKIISEDVVVLEKLVEDCVLKKNKGCRGP